MFPEWFLNLPWNIFDTLISLIELLVVCIPAISIFIYYKIHSLSVWTKEVTNNGATLVIHMLVLRTLAYSPSPLSKKNVIDILDLIEPITTEIISQLYNRNFINYIADNNNDHTLSGHSLVS